MCKRRWFSEEPLEGDVEAEFGALGARRAKDDREANEIVRQTIKSYRRFMGEDMEARCRKLIDSTEKTVAKIDKNGNIYIEEMR
jgi:hypothetical protein